MASENVYVGTYTKGGNMNVMIGHEAGLFNQGGSGNVFVGRSSAIENRRGSNNVCVGLDTGRMNDNGSINTYVGFTAGLNNKGNNNISIGAFSGHNTSNGVISIGNSSGALGDKIATNAICIGHGSKTAHNSTIVLSATGRLEASNPCGFFVKPIRCLEKEGVPSKCVWYNEETSELCFAP
jgi:hypothetical protein